MSDIGPLEYLIHGKLGILKCIVLHMIDKMPNRVPDTVHVILKCIVLHRTDKMPNIEYLIHGILKCIVLHMTNKMPNRVPDTWYTEMYCLTYD